MLDNLNELIEINLKLLNESKNKKLFRIEFEDEKGNSINDSQRFANILEEKGLVNIENVKRLRCDLTEFGYEVYKNGGWLIYLENLESLKLKENSDMLIKENLEIEVLKLQKESSEYSKNIREKERQIHNLTSDNLRLVNWDIRLKWYIAVIGFIIGFLTKYFIIN